jgi:hypothetical protein
MDEKATSYLLEWEKVTKTLLWTSLSLTHVAPLIFTTPVTLKNML